MGGAGQYMKHGRGKSQAAKRLLALSLCAVFVAVTLLSATYVFTHANHAHDRCGPVGNCTTCVNLTAALTLLESISIAMAAMALTAGGFFIGLPVRRTAVFHRGFSTLVRLKVRLNN